MMQNNLEVFIGGEGVECRRKWKSSPPSSPKGPCTTITIVGPIVLDKSQAMKPHDLVLLVVVALDKLRSSTWPSSGLVVEDGYFELGCFSNGGVEWGCDWGCWGFGGGGEDFVGDGEEEKGLWKKGVGGGRGEGRWVCAYVEFKGVFLHRASVGDAWVFWRILSMEGLGLCLKGSWVMLRLWWWKGCRGRGVGRRSSRLRCP